MIRSRRPNLAAWLLVVSLAWLGIPTVAQSQSVPASCAPIQAPPAASVDPADQPDVTVFAAASLADVFEDLAPFWPAAHPGSGLTLSFDASSALRAQIEQGAPVDVFASADARNAQLLVDACLAPGPSTVFAGNALVIVVPTGNPGAIESPADLARPGVRIVAAGPEVPITRYATEVVENLGAMSDDPAAFAAGVAANLVSEEDNVRAVLARIELGEGDAAIVYTTDAGSSDQVEAVPIPDDANVAAAYAAVTLADAPEPALASEFLAFLLQPEAQAILETHGFLPARKVPGD